jgi:hypothetical protein
MDILKNKGGLDLLLIYGSLLVKTNLWWKMLISLQVFIEKLNDRAYEKVEI